MKFESAMQGRHAIRNILAGLAVAQALSISPSQDAVEPVRRSRPARCAANALTRNGIDIINDCYNSNPDAARGNAGRASGYSRRGARSPCWARCSNSAAGPSLCIAT